MITIGEGLLIIKGEIVAIMEEVVNGTVKFLKEGSRPSINSKAVK